jgi:hypothetical protein
MDGERIKKGGVLSSRHASLVGQNADLDGFA